MTKLEKQLRNNIEQICYEYYNGIEDYGTDSYPLFTEEELLKYVLDQVFDIKSDGEGTIYSGKGICNNLKKLGEEKINEIIIEIGYEADVMKKVEALELKDVEKPKTSTYSSMTYSEQDDIRFLLSVWLKPYTHEVIIKVLSKADEIINNEFAMKLLKELADRESKEELSFRRSIDSLLSDFETFKEFNPHNHYTTHSKSYRDILYDMYIA